MLVHIDIFFMMFYYERRVNNLYINLSKLDKNYNNEFYQRLFWSQPTAVQKNFLQNKDQIVIDSKFSDIEETLLFDIAPADSGNMNNLKAKKESVAYKKGEDLKEAKEIAERMKKITLKITVKAGENGKLFGAVTAKEISEALNKDYSITVET